MTIAELSASSEVKNPFTGAWEQPQILPDHFARGVHGVKFMCGSIYNLEAIKLKTR